jgi:putative DNA-invertase from lambdoid prophage Rac
MPRTILYARVSTADQNIGLQAAQARAAGFVVDEVVADDGVSGVATRLADRPQGRRLFDLLRAGDVLVVRWVDRLGRNYTDVTDTIRDFMRRGVVIRTVINGMTFDGATQDPIQQAVRDALIAFMAATAQAQAEATREAQKAGIAAARESGEKYLGRRPSFTRPDMETVQEMAAQGMGDSAIARALGLSRQTVIRIRRDPSAAAAMLGRWGM